MREAIIKGTPDRDDERQAPPRPGAGGAAQARPVDPDEKLRPQRLSEIVGQRSVAERLAISLAAAKKRGEPLPHILFDGPPGLGKTTFATVLHNELGVELNITSGAALDKKMDVMPYLTNATEGSILFIDEIHRLPSAVEEFIYPVMEDFRVDVVLGEGMSARTINLPLKKFTIIGATTRSGMLSGPLRERFGIHEHLEFYDVEDLARIITINAAKLRTTIVAGGGLGAGGAQPRDASDRQRPAAVGPRLLAGPRRRPHQPLGRPRCARHAGGRRRGARQAGPPLPGDPDPGLRRRPDRRRGPRRHHERGRRHPQGRGRALPPPPRVRDPDAPRAGWRPRRPISTWDCPSRRRPSPISPCSIPSGDCSSEPTLDSIRSVALRIGTGRPQEPVADGQPFGPVRRHDHDDRPDLQRIAAMQHVVEKTGGHLRRSPARTLHDGGSTSRGNRRSRRGRMSRGC